MPRVPLMPYLGGLQGRLTAVVVAAASVFALVAGVWAYRWSYDQALAAGDEALATLAGAVERTAAIGAYTVDAVLLQEVVDGIAGNRFVAAAEVQVAGRVLARRARLPESGATGSSLRRTLVSPFDAKEVVGELRLVPDMAAQRGAASRQAWALVAAMVLQIALVAAVISLAAQRLITRPIGRVARQFDAIVPGSDQQMAVPPGHAHDQLGRLVAAANRLLRGQHDALERERALRVEVQAMEARYRQIFDASSAGIFVLDPDGDLINANRTVLRLVDGSEQAPVGLSSGDFLQLVFAQPERVQMMIGLAERRRETISGDLELRQAGEARRWVHCLVSTRVTGEGATRARLAEGVLYDVTERRLSESAVRQQAEHDQLTGLRNRAACEAAIEAWCSAPDAQSGPFTAMFIDLDGFKQVNDRWGHPAGDAVLRECARRMKAVVRRYTDVVGRLGGDEFCVLLFGLAPHDAMVGTLARQLLDDLAAPIDLAGVGQAHIGLSIGVAAYPMHGKTAQDVMRAADEAMYQVKRTGKNSVAMAVPERG